tara:strand:- start:2316 stop:3416 length:1101 start_codon:yes stop_codon:yes gene_type:complete
MTYIPYITTADELKTKPTQHSVKELLNAGIQPDIIMCRCDRQISKEAINKISQFCNVKKENVIPALDAKSIYQVPSIYYKAGLDTSLLTLLNYKKKKNKLDLKPWNNVVKKILNPKKHTTIAIVGKYTNLKDSYKSLSEALIHGGLANNTKVIIKWINSEKSSSNQIINSIKNVDGILVPGGFGKRGISGKIESIKFARNNNIPFFGICLGMQLAIIEIARNVLKLKNSDSSEFTNTKHKVVGLMTEWQKGNKKIQRSIKSQKGGTMRLGSYPCIISKNTFAYKIYKKTKIFERHRHRYEVNTQYISKFNKQGFNFSGMSPNKILPEILEYNKNKWFVGVQFHPELKSRPLQPHPLFVSFIKACVS